ncbi:MAG TPA: DUF515 domain-containing protein [Candidatus Sphingobacterium stercorigallinarum]|nr:DUF515 domain-containing protein [Candidatus Sphingobacterium stercorigallinarum]
MKKLSFSVFAFLLMCLQVSAQDQVAMADGLRAEGKIYVVVLVMLVIFLAVAVYLFTIDRRIKKLENDNKQ